MMSLMRPTCASILVVPGVEEESVYLYPRLGGREETTSQSSTGGAREGGDIAVA